MCMAMKLRKEDTVIVLTGSDRGKTGRVLRVVRDRGTVVVAGVNVRTLHKKPKVQGEKGSIVKQEMPVNASNVALVDPRAGTPTRVGYTGNGRDKARVALKSGETLERVRGKKAVKTAVKKAVAKKAVAKKAVAKKAVAKKAASSKKRSSAAKKDA